MSMYYKVTLGSELDLKLRLLLKRAKDANDAAVALAKEVGAKDGRVLTSYWYMGGSIEAFDMPEKPDGWKEVRTKVYGNWVFPKAGKKNKDLLDRIYALPTVKRKELDDALGWEDVFGSPGIAVCGSLLLIESNDALDNPDLVEINGSEYKLLKDAK